MTVAHSIRIPRSSWHRLPAIASMAALIASALAACVASPSPSPQTPSPSASPSALPTATPEPTATPIPHLTLPAPAATSQTTITFSVTVELKAGESGRLVVVVSNLTKTMVPELVLRWPTAVRDTIVLAPFEPSQQRIREGGDPLVQDWTKWVEGPGEQGEPAGTTSLGWGPLLPDGTLTIPVLATRVAPGPLVFALQILDGEAVLTSGHAPAIEQVNVP
ncbi:MAG: hypothetical protein ABI978_04640 [Chloroflexota bacterium]